MLLCHPEEEVNQTELLLYNNDEPKREELKKWCKREKKIEDCIVLRFIISSSSRKSQCP